LEQVIEITMLLNRAPTLHKLGIQAFFPVLMKVALFLCTRGFVLDITLT
jgi:DNA-directed RNA polymerase beta' subunit